ncbi:ATP-binding protein [Streptomyces sparsogenes]|uniref:ATP-binding protein n=1 Tax=Streptomyces sparsogenes TaxID=67365 RepID=UPI0034095CC7
MTLGQKEALECQWRVNSEPSQLSRVRRVVSMLLRLWGLGAMSGDVCIVATELLSNVDKHAGGGWADFSLCYQSPDVLWLMVSDASPAMPIIRETDASKTSGRGMKMVAELTESWHALPTRTGKIVACRFAVPPAPLPAPCEALKRRAS